MAPPALLCQEREGVFSAAERTLSVRGRVSKDKSASNGGGEEDGFAVQVFKKAQSGETIQQPRRFCPYFGSFSWAKGKIKDGEKWVARDSLLLWLLTSFSGLIVSLIGGRISPPPNSGGWVAFPWTGSAFPLTGRALSGLAEDDVPGDELGGLEFPQAPSFSLLSVLGRAICVTLLKLQPRWRS